MSKEATIHIRITPELKEKTGEIFKALGLNHTEAVTLFYRQVLLRRGLPFEIRIPNHITLNAMRDALDGKDLEGFDTADELFESLGIDEDAENIET